MKIDTGLDCKKVIRERLKIAPTKTLGTSALGILLRL